jgi:hypothetical protein
LLYQRIATRLQPFLGTGLSVSVVGRWRGRKEEIRIPPGSGAEPQTYVLPPSDLSFARLGLGWASGAGLETGARRFRLAPEVRYTFWLKQHYPAFAQYPTLAQHEFDVLLGLKF